MTDLLRQARIPSEFFVQATMLRRATANSLGEDRTVADIMMSILTNYPLQFSPTFKDWATANPEDLVFGITTGHWLTEPVFGEETNLVILTAISHFDQTNVATNVPCKAVRISPGHAWGYQGSGCTELSLSILTCLLPASEKFGAIDPLIAGETSTLAWQLMYLFRDEVISQIPPQVSTQIPGELIKSWIENKLKTTIWDNNGKAWNRPPTT